MARRFRLCATTAISTVLLSTAILAGLTAANMQPVPGNLSAVIKPAVRNRFVDRYGEPLNVSYAHGWNVDDRIALHDTPPLLKTAFVVAEDKRFFTHGGVDWRARFGAVFDNARAGRIVRGASTITEQVVRMLHARPRTPWARWLEGFEAAALERQHSKHEIFEFYLNQVPYAAQRRGIVQASRYYFGRDVSTLNEKEILSLAVLVRSPRWFDPGAYPENLERARSDLADRLRAAGVQGLDPARIAAQSATPRISADHYDFSHFLAFAKHDPGLSRNGGGMVRTTIDLELQRTVQGIIDTRLNELGPKHVQNAAALVVDHDTNEIRSWVVGYAGKSGRPFNAIDAVTVKRQPGSALKPLLYCAALEKGWTAATMLDDSPLAESVGLGLHAYHNYSRTHYGRVSLREALGNSLNIPAVRAIQYVGSTEFLTVLHAFGVDSLAAHPDTYGDGLALGNGAISLYELVQAYTVLARMGDFKALSIFDDVTPRHSGRRIMSDDTVSLIGDILSDPGAREKEFGRNSVLNFPYQTAVKTGTSSDYRDAWAVGYNDRYTVGVWLGNMDYSSMLEITGAAGPALALRAIFNELNRNRRVRPLYLSDKLVKRAVCSDSGRPADSGCEAREEWFVPGTRADGPAHDTEPVRLRKPSKGLLLAMDPRIPDESEYFEFSLNRNDGVVAVQWYVDHEPVATTASPRYAWKLARGEHSAYARVTMADATAPLRTEVVHYKVQ